MAQTINMEVLGVSRGLSPSGEQITQVSFGDSLTVDESWRQNLPPEARGLKTVGRNIVTLFALFEGEVPYKLGTKWKLTIEDNGEFSAKVSS